MLDYDSFMVMDVVHHGIHLSHDEQHVIDHPLFQRLRWITQNDILSHVFPGANHARFEHSIGAASMAGRFFDSMVSKGASQARSIEALEALAHLKACVRMAVLLHDIGHGAFSHQMERAPAIQAIIHQPGHFKRLMAHVERLDQLYQSEPEHVEHEHYSVAMAYQLLKDIRDQISLSPYDVLAIMETTQDVPLSDAFVHSAVIAWPHLLHRCSTHIDDAQPHDCARAMRLFLRSLVSNEIDADKADYMLRDARNSSVSYGNYNIDTLIDNLACVCVEEQGKPQLRMALIQKGLSAFEDFTYSRFQLYRQIYSHKTAGMFAYILREAFNEVMQHPAVKERVEHALANTRGFQMLTDHYFWEQFRLYTLEHPSSFSAMLIERKKMRFVKRLEDLSHEDIEVERYSIATAMNVNPERVVSYTSVAKFTAITPDFDKLQLIRKTVDGFHLSKITDHSDFFTRFSNVTITNFYIRPEV